MHAVLLVLHVLAAAVWVGGTVALVFVGVPVVARLEGPERARSMRELGHRWRRGRITVRLRRPRDRAQFLAGLR